MKFRYIFSLSLIIVATITFSCKPSGYNQKAQRNSSKKTKQTLSKAKSVEQKGKKDRSNNLKLTRKVQSDQHDNISAFNKKKVSKNKVSSTGAFQFY